MKKIGLALGGGSAKGFSHIGVLEVFEKNNIPIDYIAGTSMGAVVGALYSAGYSVQELKKISKEIKWENLMDFTLPDRGMLEGDKIENFLRKLLKNKKFKNLNIPLSIVAADVYKGEKIIFNSGDVASALRASIAIPTIFVPHDYKHRVLVDGGILDPVPVEVVRKMGAEFVIAVNLSTETKNVVVKSKIKGSKDFFKKMEKKIIQQEIKEINHYLSRSKKKIPWMVKNLLEHPRLFIDYLRKHRIKAPEILKVTSNSLSMMTNELSKYAVMSADFVIKPNLSKYSKFDFGSSEAMINYGKKAAESSIKEIKVRIK